MPLNGPYNFSAGSIPSEHKIPNEYTSFFFCLHNNKMMIKIFLLGLATLFCTGFGQEGINLVSVLKRTKGMRKARRLQPGFSPPSRSKKRPYGGQVLYNEGNGNQNTLNQGNENVNTVIRANIPNPIPTQEPTPYDDYY